MSWRSEQLVDKSEAQLKAQFLAVSFRLFLLSEAILLFKRESAHCVKDLFKIYTWKWLKLHQILRSVHALQLSSVTDQAGLWIAHSGIECLTVPIPLLSPLSILTFLLLLLWLFMEMILLLFLLPYMNLSILMDINISICLNTWLMLFEICNLYLRLQVEVEVEIEVMDLFI